MLINKYNDLLKRLVKGAEYLDNPLIKKEDYTKGMELYNQIDEEIDIIKEEMKKIENSKGSLCNQLDEIRKELPK